VPIDVRDLQAQHPHIPGCNMIFVPAHSPFWFECRTRCMLTAAAVPDYMGFGHDSPALAWRIRTGRAKKEITPFLQSIFDRGHEREAFAKDWLREQGVDVYEGGWWVSEEHRWGASPDGLIFDQGFEKPPMILEIKAPLSTATVKTANDKWISYYLQICFQMMCSNLTRARLLVFADADDHNTWDIKIDHRFIRRFMMPRLLEVTRAIGEDKEPPALERGFKDAIRDYLKQ
jgi:hypothetical protein